jgi:roadblock/LC7 domain-containing protein
LNGISQKEKKTMRTLKHFRIVILLALIALLITSLSSTAPVLAQSQNLEVGSLLNPDGTINTTTGVSGALDLRGWKVTLDSFRGPVLAPQSAPAAASNAGWSGFANNGLNGSVTALALMGSDLYVGGGSFNATADGDVTNLNSIAKYSGGTWSPLANNGLDGGVYALAVMGSDLYVGGKFSQTADGAVTNLNNIAKYSGGAWSPLANNGLVSNDSYSSVQALAVMGSDLYVGGSFVKTADGAVTNLNFIAKYSGGAWVPLANNGLTDIVLQLAVIGSDLYVGGYFNFTADLAVAKLNGIAKYSNNAWVPLANNGLDGGVFALAVIGSDLYVGGHFNRTDDDAVTNLNSIAKYSGGAWSPLANNGLGASEGDDPFVNALAVIGNDLYVSGYFNRTADLAVKKLNGIAKYSGGAWAPLANNGLNGRANVLAVSGSDLYVGGFFTATADGTVTNLNFIAKFTVGSPPTCNVKPSKPTLSAPAKNGSVTKTKVKLKWSDVSCETEYRVTVKNAATNKTVFQTTLDADVTQAKTTKLAKGQTYKWYVQACNEIGCTKSATWKFFTKP